MGFDTFNKLCFIVQVIPNCHHLVCKSAVGGSGTIQGNVNGLTLVCKSSVHSVNDFVVFSIICIQVLGSYTNGIFV